MGLKRNVTEHASFGARAPTQPFSWSAKGAVSSSTRSIPGALLRLSEPVAVPPVFCTVQVKGVAVLPTTIGPNSARFELTLSTAGSDEGLWLSGELGCVSSD